MPKSSRSSHSAPGRKQATGSRRAKAAGATKKRAAGSPRATPSKIDAAERMLNLLALLSSRAQPITLKQIRAELLNQYSDDDNAARAQFERDKSDLRKMGIPLDTVTLGGAQAGEMAYRVNRNNYELADMGFTEEELHALQIAAATVRLGAQESEQALWKLGAERVNPKIGPRATIGFTDPHLPTILDGISRRAALTFVYKGDRRTVDAYGMLARKGFWYLVGYDHLRRAQRVFRVDRIEGGVAVGASGTYEMPRGIDIVKAVPTDRQMMAAGDYEHPTAKVRVDASLARIVARDFGADSIVREEANGDTVFEVPSSNGYAFRLWLFAMTDKAEVLEPADVREMVVRWLNEVTEGE